MFESKEADRARAEHWLQLGPFERFCRVLFGFALILEVVVIGWCLLRNG